MPFLDLLFLKNPLYLMIAKYGLIDATMPIARFAQQRMAERFPKSDPKSDLPTNVDEVKPASQPDLLSKFIQAKTDRPEFMTDSLVMTMAVSMAFAGSETTAISLSAVFYYLLKNPRCMDALLKELDDPVNRWDAQAVAVLPPSELDSLITLLDRVRASNY